MIHVDRNIYRGPHVGPIELHSQNITIVLNLEAGSANVGDGSPLEETLNAELFHIRMYPHPSGGLLPPSLEYLLAANTFLNMRQDQLTYVHCKHGVDRTGMVIAAYRMLSCGWTARRAGREAIREGMHWIYWPWLIQLWRLK